jgi:hypothetical protein
LRDHEQSELTESAAANDENRAAQNRQQLQ